MTEKQEKQCKRIIHTAAATAAACNAPPIPGLGGAFAAAVSVAFVEMAGWALAREFSGAMQKDGVPCVTCGENALPTPLVCSVAGSRTGAGGCKRKSRVKGEG